MSYVVMARRWRPEIFEQVVAQEHIVKTLRNAIRLDRVAQAYLFSGPRGTGKTTVARILAKALNCDRGPTPDPCGECAPCKGVAGGKSMDVLEIDGASNRGIDEIRQLREEVGYAASKGKRRVYIIDEVHMLTPEAFNALLKTLEEPPPHVVFVFATTAPSRVPETIVSRCQRYNFRRIPADLIVSRLKEVLAEEDLEAEDEALFLIARKAEGALRDALSLMEQVASFSGGAVTETAVRDVLGILPRDTYFDLTQAVLEGDSAGALRVVARVVDEGGDVGEFTEGLLEHLRHLLVARVAGEEAGSEFPPADRARYQEVGARFQEDDLLRMLQVVADLEPNLGRLSEPRFWLELTVSKLARMPHTVALEDVVGRLERLEGHLTGGMDRRSGRSAERESRTGSAAPPPAAVPRTSAEPRTPPAPRAAPPPHSDETPPHPANDAPDGPGLAAAEESEQEVVAASDAAEAPEMAADEGPGTSPGEGPETVPDEGPGTTPDEADITLDAIRAGWDELIEKVKGQRISVGTFLAEGRPGALDGRQLVLAFDRSGAFQADQVGRNRETVEAALEEQFGVALRVSCKMEAGTASESDGEDREGTETDPRVQMVLRIFNGEILRK